MHISVQVVLNYKKVKIQLEIIKFYKQIKMMIIMNYILITKNKTNIKTKIFIKTILLYPNFKKLKIL